MHGLDGGVPSYSVRVISLKAHICRRSRLNAAHFLHGHLFRFGFYFIMSSKTFISDYFEGGRAGGVVGNI